MIYLLLSILSSVVIFTTFKITERFNANLVKLITVNYFTATILGLSFNTIQISTDTLLNSPWLFLSVMVGFSYIVMFFLIGYSIRRTGVAITTLAGKMSMVIPILFSLVFFSEKAYALKITGLILATSAVLLISYRPIDKVIDKMIVFLPLGIFLGSGITDSIVKYAQTNFVPNPQSMLFSAFVFLTALMLGILVILVNSKSISKTVSSAEIVGGIVLGTANFGSLYFLINALNSNKLDSSVVFGLNNICIVIFSVLIGILAFNEKLSKINFAGIFLAIAAIFVLMLP
jgi:drug/metabolite transporter (DMT)-like permease